MNVLEEPLLVSNLHKQLQLESCRRFVLREQIFCGNFDEHKAFDAIQYLFCFVAEMLQKLSQALNTRTDDERSLGFVQVQRDVGCRKVNEAAGFTAFTDAGMHLNAKFYLKCIFCWKANSFTRILSVQLHGLFLFAAKYRKANVNFAQCFNEQKRFERCWNFYLTLHESRIPLVR